MTNAELEDVYRSYGHLMLRRCRRLLRDDGLAEDALQDAVVKVMRYGDSLRSADSKVAWLYRVVDRCCFTLLGRRKRLGPIVDVPDVAGPHPALDIEARDAAVQILGRLSRKEQRVAVFAFVDGLSQAEIAKRTGWSRQTVNKKLSVIRRRAAIQRKAGHV